MERQAFLASLEMVSISDNPIEDITVDIGVSLPGEGQDDPHGWVKNGFAVTPTLPTELGDLTGQGSSLLRV